MTHKTIEEETDYSLGFPVVIRNSPRRETDEGRTVFDVSLSRYQHAALVELVRLSRPWTGSNVAFVRNWMRESMDRFGARADVSNPAVCKWEQKGDSPTGMVKGTEYLLRVHVAHELRKSDVIDAATFRRLVVEAMDFEEDGEWKAFKLDGRDLVGAESGVDSLAGKSGAAVSQSSD
jgi:DNA-binding transcriptional regulator YiaG